MKVAIIATTIALSMALSLPAFADQGGNGKGNQGGNGGGHGHAAPGPLMAAGLPVLLVAGGAYWVVRRFRNKAT
jgi:hypothetical protein